MLKLHQTDAPKPTANKLVFIINDNWQVQSCLVVSETQKSWRAQPRWNDDGQIVLGRAERFWKRKLGESVFTDVNEAKAAAENLLPRKIEREQKRLDQLRQVHQENQAFQVVPVS